MVMLNVNDKQLAKIAETLTSTQRDIRIANTRALSTTRKLAQADATREYRRRLTVRSTKSRIGSRKVGEDHFRVTISPRPALIDSFNGVKPKHNAPVTFNGVTYPRSFWQYSKTDKSRLLPLARRTPSSRNDLELITIDLTQDSIRTRKLAEGRVPANYSREFERSLVSRRRNA